MKRSKAAPRAGIVTMNDIAERAVVSQTTVSFVLSGRVGGANISPVTRERVLTAARELGYQRNLLARAVVTGKSRILSVLTAPGSSENQARILTGAHEAANQNDYLLKVQYLPFNAIDEATIVRCLEWRLSGAILVGLEEFIQDELYARLNSWGIFLTTVDNARFYEHSLHVTSDDFAGIGQVVEHLVGLGHQRIAFLGGRPSPLSGERERAFRAHLTEKNIPLVENWIRQSSWGSIPIIEENAVAILDAPEGQPTAMVCASDKAAMVVLRIARARGLRLPQDLSVTGYTNSTLSEVSDPPLTTIEQPFYQMGFEAATHLMQRVEGTETLERYTAPLLIPNRLIVRASTAPCP